MRRLSILNHAVVVLSSVTQMVVGARSEPPTKDKGPENLLSWSLPLNLGTNLQLIRCAPSWRSRTPSPVYLACWLCAFAACSGMRPSSARRSSSVAWSR